jgi:hypothetical protein
VAAERAAERAAAQRAAWQVGPVEVRPEAELPEESAAALREEQEEARQAEVTVEQPGALREEHPAWAPCSAASMPTAAVTARAIAPRPAASARAA